MAVNFNYRGPVVVFDLDDTLAPERSYCRSGFRYVAGWLENNYPQLGDTAEVEEIMTQALLKRENHYDALERWIENRGGNVSELMPQLVSASRSHIPDSGYFLAPHAKNLLEDLRKEGIKMGLITDGRSETQRAKINALGLTEYFAPDAIFISGETGNDKHKPDSFEEMVRLYPEASRFWYVGDNPEKDFKWPNLLGWQTVCVMDVDGSHIFPQPDVIFPDAAQLKINRINELKLLLGNKK